MEILVSHVRTCARLSSAVTYDTVNFVDENLPLG